MNSVHLPPCSTAIMSLAKYQPCQPISPTESVCAASSRCYRAARMMNCRRRTSRNNKEEEAPSVTMRPICSPDLRPVGCGEKTNSFGLRRNPAVKKPANDPLHWQQCHSPSACQMARYIYIFLLFVLHRLSLGKSRRKH